MPDIFAIRAQGSGRLMRIAGYIISFVFVPVSSVLMVRSAWVGAALWLILLQNPRLAISGMFALIVIEVGYRLAIQQDDDRLATYLKANGFLAAVATAWITAPAHLSILSDIMLVLVAALSAVGLALAIRKTVERTILPPLVWPHALTSATMMLLFPDWTALAAQGWNWGEMSLPEVTTLPAAMLRSIGGFFFSPDVITGGVGAILILLWSRAMFLAGVLGWIIGAGVSILLVSSGVSILWVPASYNFFLAGMALGAVFILPGVPGFFLAGLAGGIAALIAALLQVLGEGSVVTYLPIPFLSVVWLGLLALDGPLFKSYITHNPHPALRPEDSVKRVAYDVKRWGDTPYYLTVPIPGKIEITQGFAGEMSHKGRWQHALDFQWPVTEGVSARSSIWSTAVYSPVEGVTERTRNDVADNVLGAPNYAENWGNLVVIKMDSGGWALLAHLMQGTVAVVPGQRVGFTTYLGEVGNSGRSAVPHLHIQVQNSPEPGSPTQAFRLANFIHHQKGGEIWHASGLPEPGDIVSPALPAPLVHDLLAGIASGKNVWSVTVSGEVPVQWHQKGPLTINTKIDDTGAHVFCDRDGGVANIRMDSDGWRATPCGINNSPLLELLVLAAPTIPYACYPGLTWKDYLPVRSLPGTARMLQTIFGFGASGIINTSTECLSVPTQYGEFLMLVTGYENAPTGHPNSVRCTFSPLCGPVRIEAFFPEGSLHFEALSFTPDDGR